MDNATMDACHLKGPAFYFFVKEWKVNVWFSPLSLSPFWLQCTGVFASENQLKYAEVVFVLGSRGHLVSLKVKRFVLAVFRATWSRQRLLKWKDPALQEGYRCAAGLSILCFTPPTCDLFHNPEWKTVKDAEETFDFHTFETCSSGDFASVLFSVVEGRAPKAASTLTLGDVNLALTKIHNAPDATENWENAEKTLRMATIPEVRVRG